MVGLVACGDGAASVSRQGEQPGNGAADAGAQADAIVDSSPHQTDGNWADSDVTDVSMADADAPAVGPGSVGIDGAEDGGSAAPLLINGCTSFVDRTAPDASRRLAWDDGIAHDPARCMHVRIGQTVTWAGDFNEHPLGPYRGAEPSPIVAKADSSASHNVTFTTPGTFGYLCGDHPEMIGAIFVAP